MYNVNNVSLEFLEFGTELCKGKAPQSEVLSLSNKRTNQVRDFTLFMQHDLVNNKAI
jgi:hypothetical protein